VNHIGRYVSDGVIFRNTGVVPNVGFVSEQIDNTGESFFATDWQGHDQWLGAQYFFHLIGNAQEVSANTVKFVNENQTSYFSIVRITPVGFRLWLYTA